MEVDAQRVADNLTRAALVQKFAEQQERILRDYARNCLAMPDDALMAERSRLLKDPGIAKSTNLIQHYYIVDDLAKARGLTGSDTEESPDIEGSHPYHYMAIFLGVLAVAAFGYQILGSAFGG